MSRPAEGRTPSLPEAVLRLTREGDRYLQTHHLEASVRLLALFERAKLRQRVTMSYDPGRVGRSKATGGADLNDFAADARTRLNRLAQSVPPDCWNVLADVCLYEKGLQDIETERRWPRRAAKLVLRIALDQVAAEFGLTEVATGPASGSERHWRPERAAMF